jgi:hypothetical protein
MTAVSGPGGAGTDRSRHRAGINTEALHNKIALFVPDPLSPLTHITMPRMPLPPFVLVRCIRYSDGSTSTSSTAHLLPPSTYLSRYGCPPNDFLGPTGLGNGGESNGLPNATAYITHAVLGLSNGALSTNDPCPLTTRKVQKAIRTW